MTGIDLPGFVAGTLTTCAFWPQLQKTWTSKSAGNVSLGMLSIFSTGVCLWFLYGLVLHSWPIILTNAVTLVLTGAILLLWSRCLRFLGCGCVSNNSGYANIETRVAPIVVPVFPYAIDLLLRRAPQHRQTTEGIVVG